MLARFLLDLRETRRENIRRNRIFRDRTHPLEKYDDVDFYRKYRFNRATITEITDLLEDDLAFSDRRNHPYPPIIQVMAALRYYASNSFQDVIAETLVASQPSVSRIVRRVSKALAKRAKDFIIYPTEDETVRSYRMEFSEIAGFPQVVGCIDGTHVKVIPPKEYARTYRNRKRFTSINVQVVCGPNGEFTDIVAKWPGSTHDSRIFTESGLREKLEDGRYQGILLGDSGYACRSFLLTPYRYNAAAADPTQARFNRAHTKTRVLIEQTIGRWKRRFSILHGEIRLKLENAFPLIVACAVLHNIAVKKQLPDADDDDYDEADAGDLNDDLQLEQFVDGRTLRDHIAREFF